MINLRHVTTHYTDNETERHRTTIHANCSHPATTSGTPAGTYPDETSALIAAARRGHRLHWCTLSSLEPVHPRTTTLKGAGLWTVIVDNGTDAHATDHGGLYHTTDIRQFVVCAHSADTVQRVIEQIGIDEGAGPAAGNDMGPWQILAINPSPPARRHGQWDTVLAWSADDWESADFMDKFDILPLTPA
ncbi:hypothetical protein ACFC1T_08840 [Kitasatospora sp. NPDC056076]|uniref:hypothetical protein n=1 Tax=Kitasatospora sp. NPDC056076 TaxID=3345703 RepID=UPI0035D83B2E